MTSYSGVAPDFTNSIKYPSQSRNINSKGNRKKINYLLARNSLKYLSLLNYADYILNLC